jgi:hypothetical protein
MDFLSNLNKIRQRLTNYVAPIQVSVREANRRAQALLRANLRSAAKPPKVHNDKASYRSVSAGGVTSHSNRYKEPDSVIKIGGREVSRTVSGTEHDLAFSRNTPVYDDAFEPRKNISPKNAELRRANIKYQNGVLLGEVKPGDRVTAHPITSDSGRSVRARIYSRMTNGALKSGLDGEGFTVVDSTRLPDNKWRNILGEKKDFNPNDLKQDLTKLAAGQIIRRLAGHPAAQAALVVNDAVKVATGKSVTERVGEGNRQTTTESIKRRLKNGERFILPQALPY